jgi:chemotaxis protein CheX
MMLDMDVQPVGVVNDTRPSASGLISLVGITGEWGGSGVFCCSPGLAATISSRMLGTEIDHSKPVIDEEVLDVIAEVTNMVIGNIKNALEGTTGPLAISIPTVIHGRNFEFRNVCGLRGTAISFRTPEAEEFEIRIALAPSAEQNSVRSRIPVLGFAHI